MKIQTDKFKETLQKYVFEHVIPTVEGGGARFFLGAGYGIMESKLGEKLAMAGLLCDDGKSVDVDALERAITHGFKASDGKASFSVFGHKFTFRESDWNTFKRML